MLITDRLRLWEAAPLSTTPNGLETAIAEVSLIVGLGACVYLLLEGLGNRTVAKMSAVITIFTAVTAIAEQIRRALAG